MRFQIFLMMLIPINAMASHWSSYDGKFYCPNIDNSKMCALDIEGKLSSSFVKRVSKEQIDIILENGEVRSFINGDDNSYQALEVILSSRYVVLHIQFIEGGSFGLLDRHNGSYYQLQGYPYFSPDGKWVSVTNSDLVSDFSPNIFQIYRVNENSINIEFDANPGDYWAPQNVVWESASLISYTHATAECWEFKNTPCESASIKYEGGQWK